MSKRERQTSVREEIGFAMVDALEGSYAKWCAKKSPGNRTRYLQWRLRLRLRFNDRPELLEKLNDEVKIGLYDEEVGPLYDTIPKEIY